MQERSAFSFFLGLGLGVCVLGLSGCGFSPLYGKKSPSPGFSESSVQSLPNIFSRIQIAPLAGRTGQNLHNLLTDRLTPRGTDSPAQYVLILGPITEDFRGLDITKSSDTTRTQLRMHVPMSLKDAQTGETLVSRTLSSTTSYNILGSRFATRVSEQSARENLLADIARQAEQNLALHFSATPEMEESR